MALLFLPVQDKGLQANLDKVISEEIHTSVCIRAHIRLHARVMTHLISSYDSPFYVQQQLRDCHGYINILKRERLVSFQKCPSHLKDELQNVAFFLKSGFFVVSNKKICVLHNYVNLQSCRPGSSEQHSSHFGWLHGKNGDWQVHTRAVLFMENSKTMSVRTRTCSQGKKKNMFSHYDWQECLAEFCFPCVIMRKL